MKKTRASNAKADPTLILSVERIRLNKQSRFNPIRQLQPDTLSRQLDEFEAGNLRNTALLWDAMERRDDILKSVAPKRKKAVARREWEVLTLDDSPEAQAQKKTLEHFYNNLTVTHALERNMRGGLRLLVEQMMDAVGKRYAAHHIVWNPSTEGLTADLYFVPLWFFENVTGQLRFLQHDYSLEGEELAKGEWLVTYGDGLMEACSVAYMFKHLPLKDWVIYCERHGMPGFQGKTPSPKGSEQWNNMVEAVQSIAADFSCVTNDTEKIETINTSTQGELPYPKLVDRMDRALTILWRGGDLSTLSKGDAVGANPQKDESDIFLEDDCMMISETLQSQLDRQVLWYQHGTRNPLAYFQLSIPKSQDIKLDLEVDQFLVNAGAPISISSALERYGRPQPKSGEALLQRAPGSLPVLLPSAPTLRTANVRADDALLGKFLASARLRLAEAQAKTLQPVNDALKKAMRDNDLHKALELLRNDLPALLKKVNADPETIKVWEEILGTAMVNGLAEKKNGGKTS